MADELDRSFLDELDNEKLQKMGDCEYKRYFNSLSTLNKFRREGTSGFCDVILETEGRHFSVHRCVLAANSRFFYTMFNSGMRESTEKILKLPSVSCVAMENILDFFYTQEIRLTEDVIEDILEASSFLLLESLKKTCLDVLRSRMSVHNCFSTKRLALEYNAVELLDAVEDFIRTNVLHIVQKSEEFLKLSSEELSELLRSRDIRVKDETQVYFAVLKWVRHKPSVRKAELPCLLKLVHLESLTIELLKQQLECEVLVQDEACTTIFQAYVTPSKEIKDEQVSSKKDSDTTRLSTKMHNVLIGVGTGKCYRSFCYDIEDSETFILPNLPNIQAFPHMLQIDKVLYILGGESQRNINYDPVNSMRTFSFENGRSDSGLLAGWVRKPSFREVRRDTAVAVLNDKIYVLGGWMSGPTGTVECYNCTTGTWGFVASLNVPRSQMASVATTSHVLAIGGSTDQVVGTANVEQFDPESNCWTFLPPMSTRRLLGNVVFAHDMVYVLGGHDNAFDRISTCEVLNPTTHNWNKIAPLPDTLHTNQSVVTLNNEIIAIIGTPEVACRAAWYNRDADVWEKTQSFGLEFNIAAYRLCCLQVKKFFLQELPKYSKYNILNCNVNMFPKQENFVEEDDGLVVDLGLSLSEEEDNYHSDSDDYIFYC